MTTVDLIEITMPEPIELDTQALALPAPIAADVMLSKEEARQIVTNINRRMEQSRKDLLELYDREGWRALGYRNWEACAKAEFGGSAAQMYRLLSAAQIERAIDSPIGEYPESHLREVAKLDTPDQQKQALERADEIRGNRPRTAKHVQQAAAEIAGWICDSCGVRETTMKKPNPPICTQCALTRQFEHARVTDAAPDLPPEFAIVQRRFAAHGWKLIRHGAWYKLIRPDGTLHNTYPTLEEHAAMLQVLDRAAERQGVPIASEAHDLPIDFSIIKRRFAAHEVMLTCKTGEYIILDPSGAESRTRVWDQVLDRLSLLEDGMENEPPAAIAQPARPPAVPPRPRRPVSADVSATVAYINQLETYASALEGYIMALQKQMK